ncbi:hypothetical protein CO615_04180 [Lysobacteraceae bacterium NML75-0749]|nr:hypothetical protein CO615_04180 [Xanthomonadaceae bacterium NML75-0749]
MSKHTPAPWRVRRETHALGGLKASIKAGRKTVAEMYGFNETADARLIAAAPDMHALLLQIHTELSLAAKTDPDPENWEGYTLHRIEQLLWPENTGGNHETG